MDSFTPFWPETLPAPHVAMIVASNPRNMRTVMETGRVRNRRGFATTLDTYEATWMFTQDQFVAFRDFFNETLENGSLSFMLPMQDDTEIEAAFMKGVYQFSRSDNLYSVKGVLEVVEDTLPEATLTVDISEVVA